MSHSCLSQTGMSWTDFKPSKPLWTLGVVKFRISFIEWPRNEPWKPRNIPAFELRLRPLFSISVREQEGVLSGFGTQRNKSGEVPFNWVLLRRALETPRRNLWNSGENRHTYWHTHTKSFAVTPRVFCLQAKFVNLLTLPQVNSYWTNISRVTKTEEKPFSDYETKQQEGGQGKPGQFHFPASFLLLAFSSFIDASNW